MIGGVARKPCTRSIGRSRPCRAGDLRVAVVTRASIVAADCGEQPPCPFRPPFLLTKSAARNDASALLVMAFGGVARERVSAFTPPDLASRADLSASCRPVGTPPCLQARRAGARGRGRPVARGLHEVPTTNADLVDVRSVLYPATRRPTRDPVTVARRRLKGSIAAKPR
jgi:hypothetical protein